MFVHKCNVRKIYYTHLPLPHRVDKSQLKKNWVSASYHIFPEDKKVFLEYKMEQSQVGMYKLFFCLFVCLCEYDQKWALMLGSVFVHICVYVYFCVRVCVCVCS